jgi:hypothetical protein
MISPILPFEIGQKIYFYDIEAGKIVKTFSPEDFEKMLVEEGMFDLLEKFHRYGPEFQIKTNLTIESDTLETILNNSFAKVRELLRPKMPCTLLFYLPSFHNSSQLKKEFEAAENSFRESINKTIAQEEEKKLNYFKSLDSGLRNLVEDVEMLGYGDYEKFVYERLAALQKQGKKIDASPDNIDFLLSYIERKKEKLYNKK